MYTECVNAILYLTDYNQHFSLFERFGRQYIYNFLFLFLCRTDTNLSLLTD